jgi:hypothetical protein
MWRSTITAKYNAQIGVFAPKTAGTYLITREVRYTITGAAGMFQWGAHIDVNHAAGGVSELDGVDLSNATPDGAVDPKVVTIMQLAAGDSVD